MFCLGNWLALHDLYLVANRLRITRIMRVIFLDTLNEFAIFRMLHKTTHRNDDGIFHLVGHNNTRKYLSL